MTPKTKRQSGRGDQWITARQVFIGACWAALLVVGVLDAVVGPAFH
jgi:hypothetical protein